ncbi:hypothetical protein ASPFODRAFT_207423 [Aspergillus luchuensis CBS 106.47]|uniref:Metallo-beta-lactamase domain-containing protein n=1 Tax=Aspergillus luchuensis (strain CBS 106.47) TaxID=1137211 RepID=A0A1M3TFP4_ASPLC|nr:hypothetical protein ASPFODRAFT_207423 [Aspergillus luchuensis CBS 106.47]
MAAFGVKMQNKETLEYFGATTFLLRIAGLTIFHDTWLSRPSLLPQFLNIHDVTEADYILISHAHFDHLPGADVVAKRTGAIIIANCEAINRLRDAGVPDSQLLPVSGGERIPLFTREVRHAVNSRTIPLRQGGPPTAPPEPHHSLAVAEVHIWPSLHCLLPGSHDTLLDVLDTGVSYEGEATPFDGTLDITRGMKYGLFKLRQLVPAEVITADAKLRCFIEWLENRGPGGSNVMSACDGGQLMYHVLKRGEDASRGAGIWRGGVLFNAHLGAYEGIVKAIRPQPSLVVQGIAGRANLNGRPFNGSAAGFAVELMRWLGEPEKVIWCLHDECLIKPYMVDTTAASAAVKSGTKSQVVDLLPGARHILS